MLFNIVSLGQRNTLRVSADPHRDDGQGVTQHRHVAYQLPASRPRLSCPEGREVTAGFAFFHLVCCSVNCGQTTPRDCSFPPVLTGLEVSKRDSPAELPSQGSMVLPGCMRGQPVLGTCIQAHPPILTPVLRFPLETEGKKNCAKDQGKEPREVDS